MILTKGLLIRTTLMLAVLTTPPGCNAQRSQQHPVLQDAPLIRLDKLLQAPSGASTDWAKLKGKLVVLEFWATWCSPCVDQIPHLNQMASELANQPVVFISITDDEETVLNEFLKSSPLKTWIGLDSTRANWPPFDIHSIPTTVVVNPDGKLLGNTTPENLTTQKLRDLLGGHTLTLRAPETRDSNLSWDQDEIEWKDGVNPLAEVIIKPIKTATSGTSVEPGSNFLTADGVPLKVLIQVAYETDGYHMDWRVPPPTHVQGYRVVARVPKGHESQLLPLFQTALAATFGLRVGWQMQEKDVYVLRLIDRDKPKLMVSGKNEQKEFRAMRGRGVSKKNRVDTLVQFLSNFVLDSIVIDETKLSGVYDWDLPYQHGKPEITLPQLKALGFEVIKAKRAVRILVVEPEE